MSKNIPIEISFNGKNAFLSLKPEYSADGKLNLLVILLIDLAEFDVQKYLLCFPYWPNSKFQAS